MNSVKLAVILLSISLIGCSHDSSEVGNEEIFIDHYKSECFGLALSLCLRSRSSSATDWSLFYETIEGFNYEWGNVYRLKVNVSSVDNPPQDSSSKKYTLVEVLSKEPESTATTFDIAASRASGLVVKKSAGLYELYGEKEFSCTTQQCASIESLIAQDFAVLFEFTHNSTPSEPMNLSQIKCSASRESFNTSCQ